MKDYMHVPIYIIVNTAICLRKNDPKQIIIVLRMNLEDFFLSKPEVSLFKLC